MLAITRDVSDSLANCQLTHLPRLHIDVGRARQQHALYEAALRDLGVEILRAHPEPDLPDAVFVEDTAVVVDELAILTRPGADSRRPEVASIAELLRHHRRLHWMTPPATLDGGDVLRIGRNLFVGRTPRTNDAGIAQLAAALEPFGYHVSPVEVRGCLHLKSAVTQVAENTLLLNPAWVSPQAFPGLSILPIDPAEPYAANGLLVLGRLLYPTHFPKTRELLASRGIPLVLVPCDELAKAEGAVTCCSILLSTMAPGFASTP